MLIHPDRFICTAPYRQGLIQEGCPVYVHCSRVCTDRRTGDRFLQLRLVNRWEREISSLILSVDAYDAWGAPCGQISGLILPQCKAQPHSIFGEDRLIALGKFRGARIEVTVERVSFSDGLCWRCGAAASPRLLEETDWALCACGLPNPPEQHSCDLCGRALHEPEAPPAPPAPVMEEPPEELLLPVPAAKPQPVLRSEEDLRESCSAFVLAAEEYEEEEEEDGVPRWLFVLLCVIGGLALCAALAFLFFFLRGANLL